MSRYSVVFLLIFFFFAGCATKTPNVKKQIIKSYKYENRYILYGSMLAQEGDYKQARKYFYLLYEHTKRIEYLKEAIELSIKIKDFDRAEMYIKEGLKDYPDDIKLQKENIKYLLYKKKYKESEKLTLKLLKNNKSEKNYEFAGFVFLTMKNYNLALKFFERAYSINYNENILSVISDILYKYLNRKKDAIAYLETHIRLIGCSEKICHQLLAIYGQDNDINGLISVYERLYKKTKNPETANKIVELLMYQGDRQGAIRFLKYSDHDEKLLLNVYLSMQDFKNAYNVAKKLYIKTNNLNYLGKMAIYEFESAKVKNKKLAESVSHKFEKVIKKIKNPLYLNYYGYLLIDYDINIKKGIRLVKESLKKDPNSPYYLDSLAWGYYKLGLCKKAEKIIDKVYQMSQDSEVREHYNKIKKCIKKEKK